METPAGAGRHPKGASGGGGGLTAPPLRNRCRECGAGKDIVSKEMGEGRDDGVALGGAVGAGRNHVEFVTEGVGGALRAVVKWVGRALPWHSRRRRGMEANVGRRRT